MQKKRSIKIISIVLIFVLICVSITYVKTGNKEVLATTKEFNTENLQNNEHMHIEVDSSGDKVPVPNGYVGSKVAGENEIDTGYVIYEGTEEVNDNNVEEAQKTRNQYVWIPVPDASTMYGTDENGKKWGKLYDFTTETGDNINPVTGAKPLNWIEENGIIKIEGVEASFKEPYITDEYEMNSKIKNLKLDSKTTLEFLKQLEEEFNQMIDSVQRYGGFYIGRYETGDMNKEKVVLRKGNADINKQNWFSMYKKCKKLNNENSNIETGMIWGCQWDRTLMWLIESGNKIKEEICVDSTGWGNYSKVEFEYIDSNGNWQIKKSGAATIIPTGSTEYTRANNIYDLAGNVFESVMTSRTIGRAYRGGSINYNTCTAEYRYYNNPSISYSITCRAMLYIK